jgi:PAS domain S-box-containing protein
VARGVLNILVIDDEKGDRAQCRRTLKSAWGDGLRMTEADSGESGLEVIAESAFDCVLLDYSLPGINGIDVLKRIRSHRPFLPVVIIDGKGNDVIAVQSMKEGAQDYLAKNTITASVLERAVLVAMENRATEKNLRSSEERHSSIFGAVSEGIFIIDAATGAIKETNAPGAALWGYAPGELIGQEIQFISSGVSPYTQQGALARIAAAAQSGRTQIFDWHAKAKNGHLFWVEVSIRLARISDKEVVLAIVRDVTEQRATEEQLRQAQKMEAIGNLTGGMAHDFNNILGVIIGNLDLLRAALSSDSAGQELATEALDAAVRGAELTRRMLAFARRHPLQPQRIHLNELVGGIVKLLSRVLGENIAIETKLADDIWPVTADSAQLEATLTNLATNARDAMPRGGRITISSTKCQRDSEFAREHPDVDPNNYAMLTFTDTGTGMPPEVIARIFDPFFSTKARDTGTGLGLSMVFGFVKQSGGYITVESEIGVGSTFRIILPRNFDADISDPQGAKVMDFAQERGGETVLAVEDNSTLRRVVGRQLTELGYRVLQAGDAAEAIVLLDAGGVDVLFTDVMLSGEIDGFELARVAGERWPGLRVVLTSGFPESRLRETIAKQKLRFLMKPYRKDELARVLQEALAA